MVTVLTVKEIYDLKLFFDLNLCCSSDLLLIYGKFGVFTTSHAQLQPKKLPIFTQLKKILFCKNLQIHALQKG